MVGLPQWLHLLGRKKMGTNSLPQRLQEGSELSESGGGPLSNGGRRVLFMVGFGKDCGTGDGRLHGEGA